jgi:4-carboxymuconolactone decarboxylase
MKSLKFFLVIGILVFSLASDIKGQQVMRNNQALDARQQSIVPIAAFTAKGNLVPLQQALGDGLDAGLAINEIKEILVQMYAYAGFPRSLNAINTLEAVVKERKQKGIKDVAGKEPGKLSISKSKFEFGKEVQTKLTGTTATGSAQKFAPIIDTFLKEHLFADIFGRDNLDWKPREIATISALASLGGTENQLRSHFNVGLNTGLTEAQLQNIVAVLQAKVGSKEGNTAHQVLQSVLNKQEVSKSINSTNQNGQANSDVNTIFPKGAKVTSDNFSGPAWVQMLGDNDITLDTSVGNVTLEPGTRTKWHYHPGGQILLVTSGKGRYQEKGKAVRELRTGDVIKCAPNITHWHGASPDEELSHIAVGPNTQSGSVVWLEPVTEQEYNSKTKP